jgi:hypothetical protein
MGDVDQDIGGPMAVEGFAAGAAHDAARLLCRQPLTSFPDRIFLRSPVALIPPFLKVGFGPVGEKYAPCGFKGGAGLVKGFRRAVGAFARMRAGIEATAPSCGLPLRIEIVPA